MTKINLKGIGSKMNQQQMKEVTGGSSSESACDKTACYNKHACVESGRWGICKTKSGKCGCEYVS